MRCQAAVIPCPGSCCRDGSFWAWALAVSTALSWWTWAVLLSWCPVEGRCSLHRVCGFNCQASDPSLDSFALVERRICNMNRLCLSDLGQSSLWCPLGRAPSAFIPYGGTPVWNTSQQRFLQLSEQFGKLNGISLCTAQECQSLKTLCVTTVINS